MHTYASCALAILAVMPLACGTSNPPTGPTATPAPSPTPIVNSFTLGPISPPQGSTLHPGDKCRVTGNWCQADASYTYGFAFLRDDGDDYSTGYVNPPVTANCNTQPSGAYGEQIALSPANNFNRWAGGHRINGMFLLGTAPLGADGHVKWSNVVARFDFPLNWYVEPPAQ